MSDATAAPWPPGRLPGRVEERVLSNGLTVVLASHRASPIVSTALFYRAGTRDEDPAQRGMAHFLEHMMFKGAARYGPGELDRRTQALGGSNNAFTAHDVTAYHFSFAADRWVEALRMEADRMAGLRLDPGEVESERQVIVEEIAMYDDEPWDALELAVMADFYGAHPYGAPVLGTADTLAAIGAAELGAFHARHYRPDRAVLVIAGDAGAEAFDAAAEAFGAIGPGGVHRPPLAPPARPGGLRRLERRHGEVPRLLLALPGPAGADPRHPLARLLVGLLAGGRSSRLVRDLVDERSLCLGATADLHETQLPGVLTIGLELLPGVEPELAEEAVFEHLRRLREEPAAPEEIERAREVVLADWIFGHQRVHQQALSRGYERAIFEAGHAERQLGRLARADAGELLEVAREVFSPDGGATLGWSLPERGGAAAGDAGSTP